MAGLLKRIAAVLLGVSAYQVGTGYGPSLDDDVVERMRENQGGNLALMPTTRTRWYLADLEKATRAADVGDISHAAQLYRSMRRDGTLAGLLGTLSTGVMRLPKRFYGSSKTVHALQARNGTRSVFDDMFPPAEVKLLVEDGEVLGVGVAELVPVDGRDFPVMVRLDPEFLRYRWIENRWYYMSSAGLLPITPGDGRWILHTPGGRLAPWVTGLWTALGRSFINKEHAMLHRANFSAKLANPARAAFAPAGSTPTQRAGMLQRLIAWGINTVFEMPPGWDVKLIESNGRGYEVFQSEIDTCDREYAITIAGQVVTVDGGAGFSNADVHRLIRADKIQSVADSFAHTLNTQGIPSFIVGRFGVNALKRGAVLEYDVSRPKDLGAEAASLTAVATAITGLTDALARHKRELDIDALTTRFGVPIKHDVNGDGVPDAEEAGESLDDIELDVDFDDAENDDTIAEAA